MTEYFSKEVLFIDDQTKQWRQAVQVTGDFMQQRGAIESAYTDAMIAAVEQLGPYMVIAPHLAIAHAAPGTHVLKNELVLGVFKEPIIFGSDNDPVHIMIGLCALSPHGHLRQFQKIAELFSDESFWQKLYQCETVEQLYEAVNSN